MTITCQHDAAGAIGREALVCGTAVGHAPRHGNGRGDGFCGIRRTEEQTDSAGSGKRRSRRILRDSSGAVSDAFAAANRQYCAFGREYECCFFFFFVCFLNACSLSHDDVHRNALIGSAAIALSGTRRSVVVIAALSSRGRSEPLVPAAAAVESANFRRVDLWTRSIGFPYQPRFSPFNILLSYNNTIITRC